MCVGWVGSGTCRLFDSAHLTAALPFTLVEAFGVGGSWLFQLFHIFDNDVVQGAVAVSDLAKHQP